MTSIQHTRDLCDASANGDVGGATKLLSLGNDPDWPASDPDFDADEIEDAESRPWEPPLFLAAWHGHGELARMLLKHNANPDVTIWSRRLVRDGSVTNYTTAWTPLAAAAAHGHIETMNVLLEGRANVNWRTRPSKKTIFAIALESRQFDAVLTLLTNGFDCSDLSAEESANSLLELLGSSNNELIELFIGIARKAGVTEKQIELIRFVHAAGRGDIASMERIWDRGIDVNAPIPGSIRTNAIYAAAWTGNVDSILWLLNHGADPNYQAAGGTVLMRAAIHGHLDAVKALVDNGADAAAEIDGLTAAELVEQTGHGAVLMFLRSRESSSPKSQSTRDNKKQ